MAGANNQGFPQWGYGPIVDRGGIPTRDFLRFLVSLWKKTGSSFIANVNAAYLQQSPTGAGAPIEIRKASDGSLIGTVAIANVPGPPPVVEVVGVSPWTFVAPKDGVLAVESGQVELGRSGQFIVVGLAGGAIPVLKADQVRVTYYNQAPAAWFFGGGN